MFQQLLIDVVKLLLPLGASVVVMRFLVFTFEVVKEFPPLFTTSIQGGFAGDTDVGHVITVDQGRKVQQFGTWNKVEKGLSETVSKISFKCLIKNRICFYLPTGLAPS